MARFAVALTLIFSLFLLSHARFQPNKPENPLAEWIPLTSHALPDSATEPKILLPSQRLNEEAISTEEVAEFESTDAAEFFPSDDVAVTSPILVSETSISSVDDEEKHQHHHHHHHHHHHQHHHKKHHHHHKNHTDCHHHHKNHTDCHHHHKNHTDCHHHHKNHSHWEKEDKQIAREEIPSGDDLNKAEMIELFHADSTEGMIRSEEGNMKKHHHHHKEGKKHGCIKKFFHKLLKHFHY